MRKLKFIVNGQSIRPDPSCDFTELVSGTRGYLQAIFRFSDEYEGFRKAAVFRICDKECAVPIVNQACTIPEEICAAKIFSVSVVAETENYRIVTNHAEVRQI